MMARLNEPPVAPDSLELLRRRFLRQNRDIAKINSNQSLKIRSLENECARLLSENLDLRGQIIRLEQEVERNSAQRIADHALEIKAKMEAQLQEWGAMLAGLGVEPPTKRRSLEKRRSPKTRLSGSRSPPQRRRRNTGVDLDALAAQEGRLPPIYEQKSYPRATMNSEEILALCSEAADTSGTSPDLGPPPVSRYVEEDPVKVDSPSPKNTSDSPSPETQIRDNNEALEHAEFTPRRLDFGKKILDIPDLSPKLRTDLEPSQQPAVLENEVNPFPQRAAVPLSTLSMTTNSSTKSTKRKFGDENENPQSFGNSEVGKENGPLQSRRIIKEASSSRRDKAGKSKTGPLANRPPLAAKSTNDDVSSPKKISREQAKDDIKKAKSEAPKDLPVKEKPAVRQRPVKIEIPQPEPVPEMTTIPEPETPFSLATPSPDTLPRSTQGNIPHDTPPPSDIDSNGEATRPSRRARPAVSYAEPSLRVKMRRPTKELFDAVSGEGKFAQRAAPQNAGSSSTAPTSSTKATSESDPSESSSCKNMATKDRVSKRQSTMSPLAQKSMASPAEVEEEVLPKIQDPSHSKQANNTDIYDFAPSSPSASESKQQQVGESAKMNGRPRGRKNSAAVSSNSKQTASADDEYVPEGSAIATTIGSSKSRPHPRKRASMVAPKKTSMAELLNLEEGEAGEGEAGEGEAGEGEAGEGDVSMESVSSTGSGPGSKISGKDKVSRRRSMML
ncbi:hypothetical protein V8F20_001089 [Naviculisporaceae sp. PSN 640]